MADAVLEVRLHGRVIGTLTQLGGDRNLFAFTDEYIEDTHRPCLSLSFLDAFGELIIDQRPTRRRVPSFFANLLPEGRLRSYLATRAGVNETRDFPLLEALGQDLPGAVQVLAANGENGGHDIPQRPTPEENTQPMRFSLAGVQLKFSAIREARGGLAVPVHGAGGNWIVKLPSEHYELVPENEFAMMTLASLVGIDTPAVRLVDVREIGGLPPQIAELGGQALAVERFDRTAAGRTRMEQTPPGAPASGGVWSMGDERGRATGGPEARLWGTHMEDFAQVFRLYPERKYERASYLNVAAVLWTHAGEHALAQFVKRIVFSALIGNADMHLKNWSLLYVDGVSPEISPAYDLLSTIAFLPDDSMALRFGQSKRFADLSIEECKWFAAHAALPETIFLSHVRETVDRFRQIWPAEAPHLPLNAAMIATVERQLATVPLAKSRSNR